MPCALSLTFHNLFTKSCTCLFPLLMEHYSNWYMSFSLNVYFDSYGAVQVSLALSVDRLNSLSSFFQKFAGLNFRFIRTDCSTNINR